jgi:hypothetical protein
MTHETKRWALVLAMLGPFAAPAGAAEDPALLKDLTAVIALQGQPCGKVIAAVTRTENDHLATCQDGSRYRITLSPEGRVLVQKQP